MHIRLSLASHGRELLWHAVDEGVMTVGRNSECDLCVPDDSVAPVQLLLRRVGRTLTLVNRDARGTEVNGERQSGEVQLANGDGVQLGPMLATVRFVALDDAAATRVRTQTLPGGEVAAAVADFELTAPLAFPGRTFALGVTGLSIGADPGNDIVLDDPYMSSFHAQVSLEHGRIMVRDLGSRNGVFVNERKVTHGEVPPSAQLRLGRVVFVPLARRVVDGDGDGDRDRDAQSVAAQGGQHRLVGTSAAIEGLRARLARIAPSDAPVLISGETGTGKEVAARLVASLSARAAAPFVPINCGALGKSLIESELFGHEKGAFTGAVARKKGAFEAAHEGTLFLDEVGELPLELQPQLLRVLESGEVRRVGAADSFSVDVRLVAATNRDLAREVERGAFREDLYHRLHVLTLELPSLRERRDDIPLLARHFVAQLSPAGAALSLSPEAVRKLVGHEWPGNVRELRNVLQRAVLLRASDVLAADDITFAASTLHSRVEIASATRQRTLAELEREAIVAELIRHHGNKTEAAAALGLSRSTIHRKIDDFGIDVAALLAAQPGRAGALLGR